MTPGRISSFLAGIVLACIIAALAVPEPTRGGDANYDPRVLVIEWQDGATDRIPATNAQTCNEAVRAVAKGFWTPDAGRVMVSIGCERGDLFEPDEGKIGRRK